MRTIENYDCKIFTDNVEESAVEQIQRLLQIPVFSKSKIRIMPDVHAGAGCVIGFTANLGERVIPNIVGVDIGCGMLVTRFKFPIPYYNHLELFLKDLDDVIRRVIPLGRNIHDVNFYGTFRDGDEILDDYRKYKELINNLKCLRYLSGSAEQSRSMGSLGGGNHFIEIDKSDKHDDLYLVVHTGSRNLGKQVADYYQKLAVKMRSGWNKVVVEQERIINEYKASGRRSEIQEAIKELHRNYQATNPNVPNDLCWLEGDERIDYLHDMKICQELAKLNRKTIRKLIHSCFHFDIVDEFETIHNYISDDNVIRKGAISCKNGEKVIIPMNMRDGSLICIGKGNEDWNNSGPHGAGRIMSRSKAFEMIKLEDYQNSMKGIYTTSVIQETIDEAPMVYKPMDEIIENIKDTAEVVEIIKPIYNLKAEE